jgi:lipopolysaccharide export system protein LptA
VSGTSEESVLRWNSAGEPDHLALSRRVIVHERQAEGGASRDLTADRVDAELAEMDGRSVLRTLDATGAARLLSSEAAGPAKPGSKGPVAQSTLQADQLRARFDWRNRQSTLDRVEGSGHTLLVQTDARGSLRRTTGDTLTVRMRPAAGGAGLDAVASAVQQGSFTFTEVPAAASSATAGKAAPEQRAFAERGEYDGSSGLLVNWPRTAFNCSERQGMRAPPGPCEPHTVRARWQGQGARETAP